MDVIIAWLKSYPQLGYPSGADAKEPAQKQLPAYLKTCLDLTPFEISNIARYNGGHGNCKALPYHCELQPIGQFWAVVKSMVIASTTARMTAPAPKQMLFPYFVKLPAHILRSVWELSIREGESIARHFNQDAEGLQEAEKPQEVDELQDAELEALTLEAWT
ncbi:hypothetical protein BGX28_002658 [Mortierella sp. GBA30]|nr:hypothetical protein BGX28_002658 [Mortierella sp. GBA30]